MQHEITKILPNLYLHVHTHLRISSQLYTNFKRGSKLTNKGVILDKERVQNDPSLVNFDP